ncbi:CLK4-associating serine/arginine rich protein-like isoform X1 [Argiope bruennichi]|uniref:CLK4-associating serine/arginine rich protein-like isoform X1 n=1 Tax=Argiope bruennichi TaxID=94029 RepID=UPI002493E072|nr:CLK4-associating serine/arginine rich protein-like isoform X1 [Argiope bruennichi]
MWHEARKQEKKIRGMMVDYKRRAERRREYYEKIKQDPAQFLQVHGRPAKIHLDPAVAIAADSPATMMPWQGHADNLIDRFDVRAHLDIIPEYDPSKNDEPIPEDRQACYERYRTLVQNDFLGVNEDKFLHQIFIEERFGIFKPDEEKKKPTDKKAAIGYVYEDSTESPQHQNNISKEDEDDEENEEEKEEDLSDIDLDVTVDVNMLTPAQCEEMNAHSLKYGMVDEDFITYLHHDKDEAEQLKLAREIEEEKAMYSGRKSRRERRALREKKLAGRKITSPPSDYFVKFFSYAARDSPTYTPMRHSTSKSRSRSPPDAGKIMFITSFGGEGSDGEQLSKSGSKSSTNNLKPGKSQKPKDSSGSVFGPQLPFKIDDEKSSRMSRNSSYSDSSRSSHRSKRKLEKHHSRHRSRHSSHSSSGRSVSPRKSSHDKKRSRRSRTRSRSRSRSYSVSKSRSRSCSQHLTWRIKAKSASQSRSRSKSATKVVENKSESPKLPPPPVKSYYRHSLSKSNSEVSDESEEDKSPSRTPQLSNVSGNSRLQPLMGKAAPATKAKMTPQERLRRKMQLALKKQYKADKQAQLEKTEKQLQERQDRAEELREMAIKLRQRERERRHKMRGYDYDSDSDSTWTKNPDYPHRSDSNYSTKRNNQTSSRSNSSFSSQERSPPPDAPSNSRRRSRSKTPSRSSIRSPNNERRRSPYRRNSPTHRSPKRSPQRNYRRSPGYGSRNQSNSSRRYSPQRNSPRRYSPARNQSRRYSPPRNDSYRYSPSRSEFHRYSPSRSDSHRYSPSRSDSHRYSPCRSDSNRYSPSRSDARRYSPSRSDARRYSPSRNDLHRYSPTRSDLHRYSPSRSDLHRYSPSRSDSYRYAPSKNDSYRYSPSRNDSYRYSPSRNESYRYSPSRNDSYRYSPSRNDSRRYHQSKTYRQGNSPSQRSRSPSRSYGTRPLVDY